MTYFGFLLRFLLIPLLLASALLVADRRRASSPAAFWSGKSFWIALIAQVLLAVVYTTPWDNYLVANRVWYYNPAHVSGILLGYVPLEEYLFFVLEALLVGLLWRLRAPRVQPDISLEPRAAVRAWSAAAVAAIWLGSIVVLAAGWRPGSYLGLILGWALPPIALQLAFGADILWHWRRLVAAVVVLPALYLCAADALAIHWGIWSIDPAQSTGSFVAGLPLEEGAFFFVTVILLTFGTTLSLSPEGRARLADVMHSLWRADQQGAGMTGSVARRKS